MARVRSVLLEGLNLALKALNLLLKGINIAICSPCLSFRGVYNNIERKNWLPSRNCFS